jgi:hypothetical protein
MARDRCRIHAARGSSGLIYRLFFRPAHDDIRGDFFLQSTARWGVMSQSHSHLQFNRLFSILMRDAGLIETRANVALAHLEDAQRSLRLGDVGAAEHAMESAATALATLIALSKS